MAVGSRTPSPTAGGEPEPEPEPESDEPSLLDQPIDDVLAELSLTTDEEEQGQLASPAKLRKLRQLSLEVRKEEKLENQAAATIQATHRGRTSRAALKQQR